MTLKQNRDFAKGFSAAHRRITNTYLCSECQVSPAQDAFRINNDIFPDHENRLVNIEGMRFNPVPKLLIFDTHPVGHLLLWRNIVRPWFWDTTVGRAGDKYIVLHCRW
jgi:hypothetical protein